MGESWGMPEEGAAGQGAAYMERGIRQERTI